MGLSFVLVPKPTDMWQTDRQTEQQWKKFETVGRLFPK